MARPSGRRSSLRSILSGPGLPPSVARLALRASPGTSCWTHIRPGGAGWRPCSLRSRPHRLRRRAAAHPPSAGTASPARVLADARAGSAVRTCDHRCARSRPAPAFPRPLPGSRAAHRPGRRAGRTSVPEGQAGGPARCARSRIASRVALSRIRPRRGRPRRPACSLKLAPARTSGPRSSLRSIASPWSRCRPPPGPVPKVVTRLEAEPAAVPDMPASLRPSERRRGAGEGGTERGRGESPRPPPFDNHRKQPDP